MKKLIPLLVLLVSFIGFSQETISKTVGEFSTLKVYDLINVELIKSDENKVEISGKNADEVTVVNKNGTLKIRMNLEEIYDGNDTFVKLYFTNVDVLDANEGVFISSSNTFKQYELELKAQEGAQIKVILDTKETEVRAYTGGIIEVSGVTKHQNIKLNTGGIFNGKNLESQQTDVVIRAGGEANVFAVQQLDVKITAGGEVNIYNKPEVVNKKKALGGRIKYID